MIHKIKLLPFALVAVLLLAAANIQAQSSDDEGIFKNPNPRKLRLLFGGHLNFDPNGLGGTIVKDGLDGGGAKTDAAGNYAGTQSAIIPDNRLLVLQNVSGGAFQTNAGGPMTGGGLNLGIERDLGENFFFRIGLNLSTKIAGGHTTSTFAGYNWYDVYWNFRSAVVPAYLGIKINFGKSSAFYVGPGLHYYRAMWNLKGTNDGQALDAATGGTLSKALPGAADALRPSALYEDAVFSGGGFGFNYLVGAHTKITQKGFIFFELETLVSGAQATSATKSSGGFSALSPYPVYPVSVAGNYYRFGYKHEF
ncbi:MAG: porin OmpL1 [Leptospiraceae bacterium]|nr:porin OmpL1 [Leptospiraceae bacterium]